MGLVHIYWALGGKMGLDQALPTNKNGDRLLNPGKLLTFIVALGLFTFAGIVYILKYNTSFYEEYFTYAGWGLAMIFIFRAIGDFNMLGIFKQIKGTEFAEYDTKYFIPLCLFLAVMFVLLSYGRGIA